MPVRRASPSTPPANLSFYLIDVISDPDVLPFYERLGMRTYTGAILRNRHALVLTKSV